MNGEPPDSDEQVSKETTSGTAERRPPVARAVDLRLLEYIDGFDENLMCPICHCPFINGRQLPCDHTFCQQCLNRALSGHQTDATEATTCPSCRAPSQPENASPVPRFIAHMIDNLMVKCTEFPKGCPAAMRREAIPYHVEVECDFVDVECSDPGCKQVIPRHLHSEPCLHTLVACGSCDLAMMKRDLGVHEEAKCPVKSWPCRHCGETVVSKERERHEQQCPHALVSCSGSESACSFIGNRSEVQSHEASCPLALLQFKISALSTRLDRQEADSRSLRQRNALLENGFKGLKDTVNAVPTVPLAEKLDAGADDSRANNSNAGSAADVPFDSATHHLLSLHETLSEELERVAGSVSEVDARMSMMIMNENLRLREDLVHLNGVVSTMRTQLQWLLSAQVQARQRLSPGSQSAMSTTARPGQQPSSERPQTLNESGRRLSDSTTKL